MAPELDAEIMSDEISAEARLQVYQNNYQGTLTDAIIGIFPIVVAFVGEVFTRAALKHYIDQSPPREASLSTYGKAFPAFLQAYEHAADVPYIADMATLEWSIHALQHEDEVVRDANSAEDQLSINERAIFIDSEFPLLNLWMVGNGQLTPEAVHIDQGGQYVCVLLQEGQVQLFALSSAEQEILLSIQSGDDNKNRPARESLRAKNILV